MWYPRCNYKDRYMHFETRDIITWNRYKDIVHAMSIDFQTETVRLKEEPSFSLLEIHLIRASDFGNEHKDKTRSILFCVIYCKHERIECCKHQPCKFRFNTGRMLPETRGPYTRPFTVYFVHTKTAFSVRGVCKRFRCA